VSEAFFSCLFHEAGGRFYDIFTASLLDLESKGMTPREKGE